MKSAVKPAQTARSAKIDPDPEPIKELVGTVNIEGRDFQTITEWWPAPPAGVQSWPDTTSGVWLTSRVYDPFTRQSHWASA